MARSIGFEHNITFRAVTVTKTGRYVEGPYSKPGTARARVSYWKRRFRMSPGYWVDGWIERAETKWERVSE
jgi:hypothetical protein